MTGYLRGLTGKNADPANERIPWAVTTCTATPSASADVTATCNKLALITDLKGIVVTSDVLPAGYCAGKGATDFEEFRARTPFSGSAIALAVRHRLLRIMFIPFTEFLLLRGRRRDRVVAQPRLQEQLHGVHLHGTLPRRPQDEHGKPDRPLRRRQRVRAEFQYGRADHLLLSHCARA